MASPLKLDCRTTFADMLLEQGLVNRNLVVVVSDSRGSAMMGRFADTLQGQFVEAGIAEQDAVGIGAGLALGGKNAFVFAPACFLSMRSADQAKIDVAYNRTNVKLVGVSAGVSYGALGATHHAANDIAVMSSFPGMLVLSPSDGHQAGEMARFLCNYEGPAYVRMGRGASPVVYSPGSDCFSYGQFNVLMTGKHGVLAASGEIVYEALQAADRLEADGISVSVLDCCCLKPFPERDLLQEVEGKWLLTIEEHGPAGGIGDLAARALGPLGAKQERLCLPDEWPSCGSCQQLRSLYGLDGDGIYRKAKAMMRCCNGKGDI